MFIILSNLFVYSKMKMIVSGWILSVLFMIFGEMKCFLINCIKVYIIVNFKSIYGDVIVVIIIVGEIVIVGFKYGIIFVIVVILVNIKLYFNLIIE